MSNNVMPQPKMSSGSGTPLSFTGLTFSGMTFQKPQKKLTPKLSIVLPEKNKEPDDHIQVLEPEYVEDPITTTTEEQEQMEVKPEVEVQEEEVKVQDPEPEEEIKEEESREEVKEEVPMVEETPIKEPEITPEPEVQEQEEEKVEEEVIIEPEETKTKRKRKTRTKKSQALTEEEIQDLTQPSKALGSVVNYREFITELCYATEDIDWARDVEQYNREIAAVHIEADASPEVVQAYLESIDLISTKLYADLAQVQAVYTNLLDKDYGLFQRIKILNYVGANETERKQNAAKALMNFIDDGGEPVDLYRVANETTTRLNYLKCCISQIESKKSILITFMGAAKLLK